MIEWAHNEKAVSQGNCTDFLTTLHGRVWKEWPNLWEYFLLVEFLSAENCHFHRNEQQPTLGTLTLKLSENAARARDEKGRHVGRTGRNTGLTSFRDSTARRENFPKGRQNFAYSQNPAHVKSGDPHNFSERNCWAFPFRKNASWIRLQTSNHYEPGLALSTEVPDTWALIPHVATFIYCFLENLFLAGQAAEDGT